MSTSDLQLVSAEDAANQRCYITGIKGTWAKTENEGAIQPFAEIYFGPDGDIRLRVVPHGPPDAEDAAGAFASCVRLE